MPTPYKVTCYVCNSDLSVETRDMDIDGDVLVSVKPCEECLENAKEEGRQEEE